MEVIENKSKIFPECLRVIKNAPKVLYAAGNIELLKTNAISIIGSRACSIEGMSLAKQFAKKLAIQGLTIVSGMAVGIDTAAHIGALEAKGKTIAVLGCGFDNIFPKQNIKLFHEIIENNGLILSEYPPDTNADSKKFLERNRIVSALSMGVLVIEAAYRSGTSVTCKIAKEQNKKIFCVPHNLEDKHGVGTNRLIKEGAQLVTCAEDIINEFDFLTYNRFEDKIVEKETIKIDEKYIDVYDALIGPPLNINELCNVLNKSANDVSNALLMLELDGLIERTQYGYQVKNI